jgi:sulfite reductase (NADPH) flavoprotein alpha-component
MEPIVKIPDSLIFDESQKQQIESLVHGLSQHQVIWLSGYLSGIGMQTPARLAEPSVENNPPASTSASHATLSAIRVLVGSHTGNGLKISQDIKAEAQRLGFPVEVSNLNDYPLKKLKEDKLILLVISTHGEGEPPLSAEDFYLHLYSKKAPDLSHARFSVLALGDKSYLHFCKTGRDVDQRLEELGAERVYPRADADVDYAPVAREWIAGLLGQLSGSPVKPKPVFVLPAGISPAEKPVHDRANPFHSTLLDKILLNGRGSEKETYHYELSIEGSGITYEPGDSLAIRGRNSSRLVQEVIGAYGFTPGEPVEVKGKTLTLGEALESHLEISVINPEVLRNYNSIAGNRSLDKLLQNPAKLKDYLYGRDVVDLVKDFPAKLDANDFAGVLRPLPPRLYSISSSHKAHPGEVHLTVATVRYHHKRYKEGVVSSFLTDRVGEDETLPVHVEHNPSFKLPSDDLTPVVMIGPGTGVAPFRAFLEEREERGAKGSNWLFYGDRSFYTDFLYQTEFQGFIKRKVLTRMNVAFSRDTPEKVYVQHKMRENSRELYRWLQEGAHVYVCGDMQRMWKDVDQTLLDIVRNEGRKSESKAAAFIKDLKKAGRYQVDVY